MQKSLFYENTGCDSKKIHGGNATYIIDLQYGKSKNILCFVIFEKNVRFWTCSNEIFNFYNRNLDKKENGRKKNYMILLLTPVRLNIIFRTYCSLCNANILLMKRKKFKLLKMAKHVFHKNK